MRLPAALFALAALSALSAPAAQAEATIKVLNATPRPQPQAASTCARAASGNDIECTLNLGPARDTAEVRVSERIVIRTHWAAPCPDRAAQVVTLGPAPRASEPLPVVEQASSRRACPS